MLPTVNKELEEYKREMELEFENILAYWMTYSVDEKHGGFIGKIDNDNRADPEAPKGSVLNSRILWSFSAAYNLTGSMKYLQMAERAYEYIRDFFIDHRFGGVYWTVDYKGNPLDTKKQIYALSFAVYGLSEYYLAAKDEAAKKLAVELYESIVAHSYDGVYDGYVEALARDWSELKDLRLSSKDFNEKKSMNTHLHVLEGFANLYKIWPDEKLKEKITGLINIFPEHIIDPETHHLVLFFDEKWHPRSNIISYGHDIEAAWLVQEAAEIISDFELVNKVKQHSVNVADAAKRGLDEDGGLWYEYDADLHHLSREKHWWPQAEAMVGFFNAWQVTGNDHYLQQSLNSWTFVKKYILHKEKGEWFWGVTDSYDVMPGQDKVGLWKCPYHNSRACMEIIKRISILGH